MLNLRDLSVIKPWSIPIEKALRLFQTDPRGLWQDEIDKRRQIFGPNELAGEKETHILIEFFSKFLDPLILILLFASLISAVLGELANFIIISVMVTMSVVLDFYQEHQARAAAKKLREKVSLKANVIRNGTKQDINATELVPGDLIHLSAGDIVPADARLIESRDLLVNQSSLTGESFPQEKNDHVLKIKSPEVSQINNMVFMGTSAIQGEALALVVATGKDTKFGQIAKNLTQNRPPTEFEVGIHHFGIFLMRLTLILVIFVFFANAISRHQVIDSFLFALALAVGLTPELLPIVITVNLSRGATRMAKKGVIVKNLPSIQNLGGMQVLFTDKTGTLTQDKIHLERYEDVYGKENQKVIHYGFLNSFYQSGLKNPLDNAILSHREVSTAGYQKADEIPFDFIRKRLSVIVKEKDKITLITKGTPEGILGLSGHYFFAGKNHVLSSSIKEKVTDRFRDFSQKGYRVLAVAYKEIEKKTKYEPQDENNLILLGLMAFLDPAKTDADDAIRILRSHGVEVKILTGDNEIVTAKICSDIGLPVKGTILGGALENLTSDELFKVARDNTIFARLNPNQKESLILSMKQHGIGVGFLGDGINDAPSLRAADVGISVENAVDVAREAADLILLSKDLHVLKDGLIEGRKTFVNVMKYIMMGTSSNFGNMASVAVVSLFLPFLPMLPIQILLNNFLYDLSQIFLSSDNVDAESVTKPAVWNIHFINKFTLIFGPISSIFDFLTFGLLLYVFKASIPLFQTGWFIESLVTQTLIIFSIRTRVQPFYKSKPSQALFWGAISILIFSLIVPFITPLANIFGFVPPPAQFYLILIVFVLAYFTLVEKTKSWFYSRFSF